MFDIHVILQNSPGTLSRLTTLLGRHGIGLEGGGLFSSGEQSHAHFTAFETQGWLTRPPGYREVAFTAAGVRHLQQFFHISIP